MNISRSSLLALLACTYACGGTPDSTTMDPIVTVVIDGNDASPSLLDSGHPTTKDDAGPTKEDAGPMLAIDSGNDAGPDTSPVQVVDSGDAGTTTTVQDGGVQEQDTGTDAETDPAVNDAGMPMCCTHVATVNAQGTPIGTEPPMKCTTTVRGDSGVECIPDSVDFTWGYCMIPTTSRYTGDVVTCASVGL